MPKVPNGEKRPSRGRAVPTKSVANNPQAQALDSLQVILQK